MRQLSALLVLGLALATTAPVAEAATAPAAADSSQSAECPEAFPVDDVEPGMTGAGLTVVTGSQPEPFDVEVIDVVDNGIAPGIDLILVDVSSPRTDEVGIWFGMSGSPVMIDGRLVGSVAYGLAFGNSSIAGLTPASVMLDLAGRGEASASEAAPETVRLSGALAADVAEAAGVSVQQARRGLSRLKLPLAFSGLSERRFDQVADALDTSTLGGVAVRGGAGGGANPEQVTGALEAGGNFGAALSYGDLTLYASGTTTFVCDGVALAFGHPFFWSGDTTMGANDGSTVVIHDDGPFAGFKVMNLRGTAGTLDQDRLAGVRARLGQAPPTIPLTSMIRNRDTGRSRAGRTDVVTEDLLPTVALFHLWTHYDALVLDQLPFSGTATASWTLEGTRANGEPWRLDRANRFADDVDLATAAIVELFFQIAVLQENDFEDVQVTGVDYDAEAGSPFRQYRILDVLVSSDGGRTYDDAVVVETDPGGRIDLRVRLLLRRGGERTVDLSLDVPDDFRGGGLLSVRGGGFTADPFDCLFFPEECLGGEVAVERSLDGLLEAMADAPRNDELVAELISAGEMDEEPSFLLSLDETGRVTERLDEVVVGDRTLEVAVGPACPPDAPDAGFVDVRDTNVHRRSINCVAHRGIARGVSLDPPRFAPERPVTRAQMATFVAESLRTAGYPLPEAERRFADVAGNPHEAAINALAEAGILRGRTPTTFAPGAAVTRGQAASLLVGALQWAWDVPIRAEDGPWFEDASGSRHAGNIDAAFELGLVQGDRSGRYRPNADIRRDQTATVVVGLLDALLSGGR